MRADLAVVKRVVFEDGSTRYTEEFKSIEMTAAFVIALYAIILPFIFFYALFRERRSLVDEKETQSTRALAFLHRPYKPQFWYFETTRPALLEKRW